VLDLFKHITGLCGEPHLNIYILIVIAFIIFKKYILNDITY
tara:strand:+ start:1695 stop:1817 length:123 start_codon:yes stop_codon:yes gene_type:complete